MNKITLKYIKLLYIQKYKKKQQNQYQGRRKNNLFQKTATQAEKK